MTTYTLTLSCYDDFGIVAAVASFLSEHHGFILQSDQFSDIDTDRFFMRVMFRMNDFSHFQNFGEIAEKFRMEWSVHPVSEKPRVLILVSRADHCLNTLLNRWKRGRLPIDIVAVASNHTDLEEMTSWYKVPFYHLPITPEKKSEQEQQIFNLVETLQIDLVILARYMQILSPDLVSKLSGKIINIHHSFLPSFKGAKPYHQAYARGVKLIGATAHYVTDDLDEGPIIEQEVERVDHSLSPSKLVNIGRDTESKVLLRAVELHAERRVFLNGNKTVIFS